MSIVHNLDVITKWAHDNICNKVKLKLPDDNAVDASYDYKLVTPAAFSLLLPSKDRMPPDVEAPIPSLCVQMTEGTDLKNSGTMKLRFGFSAWSPGIHGKDMFIPKEATPGIYEQWDTDEARAHFRDDNRGWRDIWNFVDVALRELESTETIDCLRIVKEDGISFGPFAEKEVVPDFYPYWFAWVSFTVSYGITRNNPQVDKFL